MSSNGKQKKGRKVSLYFLDGQYDALATMAKDNDRSVAYLMREAVSRFLVAMGYDPNEEKDAA